MRQQLLDFVQTLRAHAIDVSLAESLDALAAVGAVGVERGVLREGLAATLVKDERDRPEFDRLFDVAFPLVGASGAKAGRRKRGAAASGEGPATGRGRSIPGGHGRGEPRPAPRAGERAERSEPRTAEPRRGRPARLRGLLVLPLREFTAHDVAEARELVEQLGRRLRGRLGRRWRQARRGRLDFRRTLRAAAAAGGVPLRLHLRGRRPDRADLVALCDVSGSVARASELCLGLLAPAADHFRRVDLFAFVDRLCPVSIEGGHVAPEGKLDLHARSDYGRVFVDLWTHHRSLLTRSTLLLVLGDARSNRLPPHAEVVRQVRERVQRLVWIVPEERSRWDSGDSVLARYAPACDAVIECLTLDQLRRALGRVL